MKYLALIFTIVVASTIMPSSFAQEDTNSGEWCVSVWFPSSEHPDGNQSILNNVDVIDEVNPFWYVPRPDGTLIKQNDAEDPERVAKWRELGLQIVPTIVSFGTADMIMTDELREYHIQEIVDLVESNNFDGIDIDYEGFALNTKDPFSTFIEELAEVLHANDRILSMAVHAKTEEVSPWDAATAQDWPRLTAAVDIFRIMTYDHHNRASEAGPISPTPWNEDVLTYAASITDLSKVRLGLHFYGYSWRRGNVVAVVTWETVSRWQESFDLSFERDPTDQEANATFKITGLPRQTVYIADSISLAYKLDVLLNKFPDLGGVSIWGLGGEDPENWDILRSIDRSCNGT